MTDSDSPAPVSVRPGGMLGGLILLEVEGGFVELTPGQARAVAADLTAMADEADT